MRFEAFLVLLIVFSLIAGAINLATERYRRIVRDARIRNSYRRGWPKYGHSNSFYRDLKRIGDDLQ